MLFFNWWEQSLRIRIGQKTYIQKFRQELKTLKQNAAGTFVTQNKNTMTNSPKIQSAISIVVLTALSFYFCSNELIAQTRLNSLEIGKNKVYQMQEDTLIVVDLILRDSSTLMLNKVGSSSYIKATRIIVEFGANILGKGAVGAHGTNGKQAIDAMGACQDGLTGGNATKGSDGGSGKNLIIEATELKISDSFHIYLAGGNGGDGGNGGNGSAGSKSSTHCKSHGGDGGIGGIGGGGGGGGTFTINYQGGISLEDFYANAVLHNGGGYQGLGGEGGKPGLRGRGASEHLSKHGLKGKRGTDGKMGREGQSLFYSVQMAGSK